MPRALLFQAFTQSFHQFFESAQRFYFRKLLVRENEFGLMQKPFLRHFCQQRFERVFDAIEMRGEDLVESIEERLVFYETGTGQVIEVIDTLPCDAATHRFKQRQQLCY